MPYNHKNLIMSANGSNFAKFSTRNDNKKNLINDNMNNNIDNN